MVALRTYSTQQKRLNQSLERLSTGLAINTAADDPSGLVASERLRSEQVSLKAAISNAQRASNVVATAEGALNEVSGLLLRIQTLVTTSANETGLSEDEIEANQNEVDSILDTIDRISGTTSFADKSLLDGSLDFYLSGVPRSAISDVQVYTAALSNGNAKTVTVEVAASATYGQLKYTGSEIGADSLVLEVAGSEGGTTLRFSSGTSISAVAVAVNQLRDRLGVSATLSGTGAIYFTSTELSSDSFVRVNALDGTFGVTGGNGNGEAYGQDAEVFINGLHADVQDNIAKIDTEDLSIEMTLEDDFLQTPSTKSLSIVGGGATFSITANLRDGPLVVGIASCDSVSLANEYGSLSSLRSGGFNDLSSDNLDLAQTIVEATISEVASERARLGGLERFTLDSFINSLQVTLENITATESSIRDADYATEVSNMTSSQILLKSAGNVLRQANDESNIILELLSATT
jgi:flagellin